MKIFELFQELGLDNEGVGKIHNDIKLHNSRSVKKVPLMNRRANIETIKISQLRFIGNVLGKERNRAFLDDHNLFPLSVDVNAMHYGMKELDKYFKKGKIN